VYRGDGTIREITTSFGLRSLWQDPRVTVRHFFNTTAGNQSHQDVDVSLWQAGNMLTKSVRYILQNGEMKYGLASGRSTTFGNDTDVLYIVSQIDHSVFYHRALTNRIELTLVSSACSCKAGTTAYSCTCVMRLLTAL
jgi:hypothetical protein